MEIILVFPGRVFDETTFKYSSGVNLWAYPSHAPTRETQKGNEDRQVKTRHLVTYLSWKLSQFPLHYSRRAFEHHLLPQKKVKSLGNRDSQVRLTPSEC